MNQQELAAATSIGLLYLIRMLGLFMVLPVLPLLGQEITGATPFLIGLAIGIYGLSQASLQIPFGLLSDRIGRKEMIGLGLLLSFLHFKFRLSAPLVLLCDSHSLPFFSYTRGISWHGLRCRQIGGRLTILYHTGRLLGFP